MTVEDLIKELKKHPKDMPVWNGTDNYFTDFKLEKFMFYLCDADDECEHLKIIREW